MRAAIFLILVIAGSAFAQFENVDANMARCEKTCCTNNNGNWSDSENVCSMGVYTSAYNSCEDSCFQNATGSIGGSAPQSSFCCAPSFVLLALTGFVVWRG